jgi:hypothetical protein
MLRLFKKHQYLVLFLVITLLIISLLLTTTNIPDWALVKCNDLFTNFINHSTERQLPEYCQEFTYDGKPLDCSAKSEFIYNEVTAYICIFDKIVQEKEHYFLLVKNKNANGNWISKKYYLGQANQYVAFREQYHHDYRPVNHITKMHVTHYQVKDLPLEEYNKLLKYKEIILLVFNKKYKFNDLQKVSHIRYISEI